LISNDINKRFLGLYKGAFALQIVVADCRHSKEGPGPTNQVQIIISNNERT